MELTHDDVAQILRLLEESSVDYLEVRLGDVTLVADRNGSSRPTVAGAAPQAPGPETGPVAAPPVPRQQWAAPAAEAPPGTRATAAEESGGAGPDSAGPDSAGPDSAGPDSAGPDSGEPESGGPDSGGTDGSGRDGLLEVTAPVLGVFFASPEPGAPPYVEVGTPVDEDTTMGLIEVMKMFNSVTSGVRGEVARILARNEEFVEYGQPLFLVRPHNTD